MKKSMFVVLEQTGSDSVEGALLYIYLFAGALFVAGLLFLIYWLHLKRKNAIAQLQIAQLKKDEAEVQIRLKEEMLKQSELEKYEALIDIHFKGQELKLLIQQKEKLEEQILEQTKELKKFETQFQKIQTRLSSQPISDFLDEVKQQILSKLGDNERTAAYLQEMDKMDETLFLQLDKQCDGKLSPAYLRYCICFFIDMSLKDIADCLCVEVSTVHIARYRLKRRLKLGKDEDLNFYFKYLKK